MPARSRIAADRTCTKLSEAVHQPDRGLPVLVLPQNVGITIAVEVASALDVPGGSRIAANRTSAELRKTIHCPNSGLAVVILPKKVCFEICIEVGITVRRWRRR